MAGSCLKTGFAVTNIIACVIVFAFLFIFFLFPWFESAKTTELVSNPAIPAKEEAHPEPGTLLLFGVGISSLSLYWKFRS